MTDKTQTKFYRVECSRDEDFSIYGYMIRFAMHENIGSVGTGFSALHCSTANAVYFSYTPGQVSHPSMAEQAPEALIKTFEEKLTESGLRWTTFDLTKLLETVAI